LPWEECGSVIKVIAYIDEQQVVDNILSHLKKLTDYHLIQMGYQKPERHHTNSRRHEANNSLPLLDYCVLAIELKPDSGSRGAIA
jgi:hypothetical protein